MNTFTTSIYVGLLMLMLCLYCQEQVTKEKSVAKPPIYPTSIIAIAPAQAPEGIEYNINDSCFYLSSVNARPIVKVELNGTVTTFASGEPYPLSTAGLQIDYTRNWLLAASCNGLEVFDTLQSTTGQSNLRAYDLNTGKLVHDISLSASAKGASAYFANDLVLDRQGNIYVSDWMANLIYKIDTALAVSVFWKNPSQTAWPNGMEFHPDGHLLVSLINQGYTEGGLIKLSLTQPNKFSNVEIPDHVFLGFDGMLLMESGHIVGVTNDGKNPGGNLLIELASTDNWITAKVIKQKHINASTTVADGQGGNYFIINQDFQNNTAEKWTIERINF